MDYEKRWEIVKPLDAGGQGQVYRVFDKKKNDMEKNIFPKLEKSIMGLISDIYNIDKSAHAKQFTEAIKGIIELEHPHNNYALKVLHEINNESNGEKSEKRIKAEIEAMSKLKHPNLLKIIDYDVDNKWYVSTFYYLGTLKNHMDMFTGNVLKSLKAIRPLVEGVGEIHNNNLVHRDIKPENIFIDLNNKLVLGDFGLVFFIDSEKSRVTDTLENVGSRRWMPSWATDMRIEDIRKNFDVFSLGKLLWSMVSGKPMLRLWYFDDLNYPNLDLVNLFPEKNEMELLNALLSKCIVEHPSYCLSDANELLRKIDDLIQILDRGGDLIGDKIDRACKVCGIGKYRIVVDKDYTALENFGMRAVSGSEFKIFTCSHCGHVQFFSFSNRESPPAWKE